MRKWLLLCLSVLLVLSLGLPAFAAQGFVYDEAGLLSAQEEQQLNAAAEEIAGRYGCGIYMVAVQDFRDYTDTGSVYEAAWGIYHGLGFGVGENREGMLLLLSMEERNFATFFYGENTEYAFSPYAQEQLEAYFLGYFGNNDWYGGYSAWLEAGEQFLAQAAAGNPVRENRWKDVGAVVLISALISLAVTAILWSQRKNVRMQHGAAQYIAADGLSLTRRRDMFIRQTRTRRKIETQSASSHSGGSSGSRAHSGGGGSGRSGKF